MDKKYWIHVDKNTKEIIGVGTSHCAENFEKQCLCADEHCEYIEFTGGAIGYYFVDGEMQENPPL